MLVSLQSYSPFDVGLGLRNAHFWGFLGDFSVRVEIYKLLWCIIKLHPDRILCETDMDQLQL